MTAEPPPPRWGPTDWIGLLLLIGAAAAAPLLIYPFPTQDGPQHAFTAFAYSRLSNPELGFGQLFETRVPLSSQGFVYLLVALDRLFPFDLAERLALALTLAAYPIAGGLYARMVRRPPLPVAGLLLLTAYGWALVMGFFNFLLAFAAVPVMVGLVAGGAGSRGIGAGRAVALGALLVGLAWLHLAVAAIAGALCAVAALGRPGRGLALTQVLVAGIPAGLYAFWAAGQHVETGVGPGFLTDEGAVYVAAGERLSGLWALGPGALSIVTGVATLVGFGVVLGSLLRDGRKSWSVGLWLALAWAFLTIAYLVAPLHMARWAFLGPRLLFAAAVAMSLISTRRYRSPWFSWALLAVFLGGWTGAAVDIHRLDLEVRPLERAVVDAPHRLGAPLLPLELLDEPFPHAPRHVEPTLHLANRLIMRRGGLTPYLFAFNRAVHSIHYRESPTELVGPAPGAYIRRGFRCGGLGAAQCLTAQTDVSDRIAYYGLRWGEVLLLHPPEILSFRLRERGFRLAYRADGVELWAARPSALDLEVAAGEGTLPATLVVRAGYLDSVGWVIGRALLAGTPVPASLNLRLEPLMAGPTDLEVFFDANGDTEPDPGGRTWRPESLSLLPGEVTRVRPAIGPAEERAP